MNNPVGGWYPQPPNPGPANYLYDANGNPTAFSAGGGYLGGLSSRVNIGTKGAQPGRAVADAVTNSTTLVTSATAAFTQSDVNSLITICDQGNYANIFSGTIASVQSATNATLSGAASFSASGCGMALGPDNTTVIANAISSLSVSAWSPVLFIPNGIFLTTAGIIIPNGCSVEGQGCDYGLATTPIGAGSALLLAKSIGGTAFVQLGTSASTASGATRASLNNVGIDGCNNTQVAVAMNSTRARIVGSQVWRGTVNTCVVYTQNNEILDSVIAAHNVGNTLNIQSSDCKVIKNQIRQAGNSSMSNLTGHQIYVLMQTGVMDCHISENHIFSGYNGTISSSYQGSNVYIRATGSSPSICCNVENNSFDSTYGPQVVIRNEGTSRLSQINVSNNQFWQTTGFPDATFAAVSIQNIAGSIRGVTINSNNGNGNVNNYTAIVMLEAGATGSQTGVYTHTSVNDNVFQNANLLFGGTYYPDDHDGNVISENAGTTVFKGVNGGVSTQNGTGSQTAFTIAHGLAATPTQFLATAGSSAASALYSIAAGSANLTVTYTVAPALGTGNVVLNWWAKV